jgi:hypothetical protein
MRLILIFLVAIIGFGCSSAKKVKFGNEYLKGNWLVISVSVANKDLSEIEPVRVSSIEEKNEVLSIYNFDGNGNFTVDTSGLSIIKGSYTLQDTILTLKTTDNTMKKFFRATQLTDSTMAIVVDKNEESTEKLLYDFAKVTPVKIEQTNAAFDISNVKWKIPLPATADDTQIKERLKTILLYYSNYFKSLTQSGATVFSEKKVFLPIKLYSGGLGLKAIEGVPEFITIMGSSANAAKAKQVLSACFDTAFKYPERGNYMDEYAEVLLHLAQQVK